jgi:predicted nucleic acid-binding protein
VLIATAAQAGCTLLLSEYMHDGLRFGSVTVRHPFAGARLTVDVELLLSGA